VVEGTKNVCSGKTGARDADELGETRRGEAEITCAKVELLASNRKAAGRSEARRCAQNA
jgi:hypothetical protein